MSIDKYSDLKGFDVQPVDVATDIGLLVDVRDKYYADIKEMLHEWDGPEPWGLVCTRPNGDVFLVDKLGDWFDRICRKNLRHIVGLVIPTSHKDDYEA